MTFRKTLVASTLVLATVFAGAASANLSTGSLANDVQSAVSSGSVNVFLKDGVATLTGAVDSQTDAQAAVSSASHFQGVERVINQLNVSS